MPVALQVVSVEKPARGKKVIRYKLTLSGNYPAGGDPIDLGAATNPKALPGAFWGRLPDFGRIVQGFAGDDAEFILGTTLANSKLKLYSAANTELAAAAYNAALTGNANLFLEVVGSF